MVWRKSRFKVDDKIKRKILKHPIRVWMCVCECAHRLCGSIIALWLITECSTPTHISSFASIYENIMATLAVFHRSFFVIITRYSIRVTFSRFTCAHFQHHSSDNVYYHSLGSNHNHHQTKKNIIRNIVSETITETRAPKINMFPEIWRESIEWGLNVSQCSLAPHIRKCHC